MKKRFRVLSLSLVAAFFMTSMPVNGLAQAMTESQEMPEVQTASVDEMIYEEEPEMDLLAAVVSEDDEIPEVTGAPEAGLMPETSFEPEDSSKADDQSDPEASTEPDAALVPESSMTPEASEVPEETLPPENAMESPVAPEQTEVPMVVLESRSYLPGMGGLELVLAPSALPVVSVDGLEREKDYFETEDGIALNETWLESLNGEVLVCIFGSDGVMYVQPICTSEQLYLDGNGAYDVTGLEINGEALVGESGDGWRYASAEGVLYLMGESMTLSGQGRVHHVDVDVAEKLTLSNLNLSCLGENALTRESFGSAEIDMVLTGNNTIACRNLTSESIVVEGSGSLNCEGIFGEGLIVNGGALKVANISLSGDLVVNGGEISVSGNGAGAIIAKNITIAKNAKVSVRTSAAVSAFVAVNVSGKITNGGTLEVEVLPGSGMELYGVKAESYEGNEDVLRIVNNQTHMGTAFYSVYIQNEFNSQGTVQVINAQPLERMQGLFSGQTLTLLNLEIKNQAEVCRNFVGAYAQNIKADKGGNITIVMDCVGEAGSSVSYGLYAQSGLEADKVTVSAKTGYNIGAIYAGSQARLTGKVAISMEHCGGKLTGIQVWSSGLDYYGESCVINIDGGNTAVGIGGYSISIYGNLDINIKNVKESAIGIYDRSGSQTALCAGEINIDVYDNLGQSLGMSGSIRLYSGVKKLYIVAESIGREDDVLTFDGQEKYALTGIILEYADDSIQIVEDYYHIVVDGTSYDFYPGLKTASGRNWSVDADAHTLTLDGFNGNSVVWTDKTDALRVVLKGDNTLGSFDSFASQTTFAGEGQLKVDGTKADGLYGIAGETLIFEGGHFSVTHCEVGLYAGEMTVEGASVTTSYCTVGLWADGKLTVTNQATLDIYGGYRAMVAEKGWILNGQPVADAIDGRLTIKNGEITARTTDSAICVGGWTLLPDALSQDQSGEGWQWRSADQTLVLKGYKGMVSSRGFDLKLSLEGTNSLSGLYATQVQITGKSQAQLDVVRLSVDDLTVNGGNLSLNGECVLKKLALKGGSISAFGIKADESVTVSGGELLTGNVTAGQWSVSGGTVNAGIVQTDAFRVSGGEVEVENLQDGKVEVSGGSLIVYAEAPMHVDTIQVTGGELATVAPVKCEDYRQTGGTVQLCAGGILDNADIQISVEARHFLATGGILVMVNLSRSGVVLKAGNATFGGGLSAQLYTADRLFEVDNLDVCGESDVEGLTTIHIESGEIIYAESDEAAVLEIDGVGYSVYALAGLYFGGQGWMWDPLTQTLTLSNYSGGAIYFDFEDAKVHLEDGTKNEVSGDGIVAMQGLTVTGDGALTGDIFNYKGTLALKNRGRMNSNITNMSGNVTLTNVNMYGGSAVLENGSLTINGSNVQCDYMHATGNITLKNSVLYNCGYSEGDVRYYDLYAGGKLKASSSLIVGQYWKGDKGFSYDKYTAVFKYNASGGNYQLVKDATIRHTWKLPAVAYVIPKKRTLTIASGYTLYYDLNHHSVVSGSGKVKGKLVDIYGDTRWIVGPETMVVGTSSQLKAYIGQDQQKNYSLMANACWVSSDPDVATVNSQGVVTVSASAQAGDVVTIYAADFEDTNRRTQHEITIVPGATSVAVYRDGALADAVELWLDPANKTVQLDSWVSPAKASQKVTWTTTNKKVATVSSDGKVTAKAAGSCYIYAKTTDGTQKQSQRIKVTVKKAPTSIKFTASAATLAYDASANVGSSLQLKVKLSSGSGSSIVYKSSNAAVASVDENGVVTARQAGKATITAATYNGKKATCKVTVKAAPDKIEIAKDEYVIGLGDSCAVAARIPAGTAGNWTYTTSDAGIVAVEENTGKLSTVALGEATITATTFNGYSDTCKVTVLPAPDGVTVEKQLKLGAGEKYTLNPVATLNGAGETAATFTFKSYNTKVLSVDANGKITAKKAGKTKVSVTTYNGKTAYCEVVVAKAPSSIKLSRTKGVLAYDETLKLGTSYALTYKLSSGSASKVVYTSSNSNVVRVDENGLLTAVGVGTAKIKATTFNKKSSTCTVTVKAAPSRMIFEKDSYKVALGDTLTVKASAEFGTYTPSCTYESSESFVAMVDKDSGTVKPVTTGSAMLTARAFNGAVGTAEITVVEAPEVLTLNAYKGTLKRGKKFTIVPSVSRLDGSDTASSYTFKSSRPSVCSVSSSGVLYGRKKGTAIITVTTYNNLQKTVRVTVK